MALKRIIDPQHESIGFQKNREKDMCNILLVVDDFQILIVHDILSTQKYNVLAPIIRLNASALFVFRLKNVNEVNVFLEWWTQATAAKCIIKP